MKFRIGVLAIAYVFLWGMNSYAFPKDPPLQNVRPASVEWDTHLIPLMLINGELIKTQDLLRTSN